MAATLQFAGLSLSAKRGSALSASRSSSFTKPAPQLAQRRAVVVRAQRPARTVVCVGSAAVPKVDVLDFDGTPTGQEAFQLNAARPETAKYVVHRAVVCERANKRQGSANTKTRSEVRGGGIKPYKQKGTGRARMGSKRTPLRPGGGVTFGPKPKDWGKDINKKEKRLAISTALQSAAVDMTIVEDFESMFADKPSTAVMSKALAAWGLPKNSREHGLLITKGIDEGVWKSARNISNLKVLPSETLNVYDICRASKLFITRSALEDLRTRYPTKGA